MIIAEDIFHSYKIALMLMHKHELEEEVERLTTLIEVQLYNTTPSKITAGATANSLKNGRLLVEKRRAVTTRLRELEE